MRESDECCRIFCPAMKKKLCESVSLYDVPFVSCDFIHLSRSYVTYMDTYQRERLTGKIHSRNSQHVPSFIHLVL